MVGEFTASSAIPPMWMSRSAVGRLHPQEAVLDETGETFAEVEPPGAPRRWWLSPSRPPQRNLRKCESAANDGFGSASPPGAKGPTAMARRPDRQCPADPYTVGYRKPPIATQFKKGCSGNPSGRPRRSRNVRTILKEILNRKITVRDCHGERKIATQEAMLLKFLENALKGDPRALKTTRFSPGSATATTRPAR